MKPNKLEREYGITAKSNIEDSNNKRIDGALACLETFYYAFNHRDLPVLKSVWLNDDLIQLNNPVGGITRGQTAVMELYSKILNSHARLWVEFRDINYYFSEDMVVFAGTEVGEFISNNQIIPLKIRTTRIFGYVETEKRWFQVHHHGSIDNSQLLLQYQNAVRQ